jgi:putative ABC transport system ATP-binding protein
MNGPQYSEPIIQIKNIVKRFAVGDAQVTILKGVSLQIHAQEFVAIVGASGSGKSTLMNMVTGIDHPSDGEVIVLGKPIHRMSENDLARWRGQQMGIIFQFFQLLPALTLLKNVILPMDLARKYSSKERQARALHLLETVGLVEQAHKLPSMVSGGQQQRAAIARALANDPPLLVADEPTGNLDSATAHRIFELFRQLVAQGKTLLIVTHDKELAQTLPRRIEIMDGQIVYDQETGK